MLLNRLPNIFLRWSDQSSRKESSFVIIDQVAKRKLFFTTDRDSPVEVELIAGGSIHGDTSFWVIGG